MRNTGLLLFLVGIYIILNSGSFRDVILGKATLNFQNQKKLSEPGNGHGK